MSHKTSNDPVVMEAREILTEQRHIRRALFADFSSLSGTDSDQWLRDILDSRLSLNWLERLEGLPLSIRLGLLSFDSLQRRLDTIMENPTQRKLIDQSLTERARLLRIAAKMLRDQSTRDALLHDVAELTAAAAASNRPLTEAELRHLDALRELFKKPADYEPDIASAEERDEILEILGTARIRQARIQLRRGLLLTDQMLEIIAEARPALHSGDPILLIGETGGAKTALAEYLSRQVLSCEPEFVSGYGDITTAQLIGTYELRVEDGSTITSFVQGPLLRAMAEGKTLILDELNAMPPEFLKRLNHVLQLRHGDSFAVQENAGHIIKIAKGFTIIATANEQVAHRYRGIERMSAELTNRFGANSYRIHYPDAGLSYTDFPAENALLAVASIADPDGTLPRGVTSEQIERIARAAFVSQQVFSANRGEGFGAFRATERALDSQPGLQETVIAPRTLVAILRKVTNGVGVTDLDRAVHRFVEGIMQTEDRQVLTLILRGQGFLL